ncbi:MAG: hypothetical protein RMJ33_08485 [Saprospiraceae bacterium]|nr:hypothetical protein [Saprospiraceae bacterium]MDW8229861.1 hypothetical protein [Saprospiraceae bacterium]
MSLRFYRSTSFFILFLGVVVGLNAQPDTVRIGLYVNDIYDINLSEKSFSAQFWVWLNYQDSTLRPEETLEFPNAKEVNEQLTYSEEKGGIRWATKRITAVFKKDWDIRRFPFDVQKMVIEIEESDRDTSDLVYVPDVINTKIDPQLGLSNWRIERFELITTARRYDTTYGDPTLSGGSAYAHAEFALYLRRKTLGLFFSLFTGMYVSFFISWLVFFIDPVDVDPRFGLSVGGLFAAVGNKYIVDSILPQSTTFTLVDKLHVLTYFFLLLCIVLSVASLRVWKNGNPEASARFDRRSWMAILITYALANTWLIWEATQG